MFQKHSVAGRVATGKLVGFIVGGAVYFLLPLVTTANSAYFNFGVWLLFVLMGGMIGFIGIFKEHPVFGFKLTWCMRGGAVGFVFFLLLVLLAYGEVQSIVTSDWFSWTGFTSPWWILIDGVVYGMIIGFIATKISGEGALPVQ